MASITVQAIQPGNPSSTAIGSWSAKLFPPGSPGYDAAKAIYDQLDYGQRVEFYISHDGASLGKLYFAGIITGIDKTYGGTSSFTLTGQGDLFLVNLSRPFPGEILDTGYQGGSGPATYRQARNYFGMNELGHSDAFNPFTAANYTSTHLPGLTAGSWSSTADDGLSVVSCATGTGAVLISKMGAVPHDKNQTGFVEVTGRLKPANDATNGGRFGIGLSKSNRDCNDCAFFYVTAKKNATTNRYDLDVTGGAYIGGTVISTATIAAALASVDDPDGFIPFTISLWNSAGLGGMVVVNGQVIDPPNGVIGGSVVGGDAGYAMGLVNTYPFLMFGTPASGTATVYHTNLVQMTRYADDQEPGTALIKSGTIGTPAHSLGFGADPGPTFLEAITRANTREGWYWRYTPQPFVGGKRTLGTIDMIADPGTDLGTTKRVVFSRDAGNLVGLQLSANADALASGTAASSVSGTDGGGIAYWRDIATMTKYGVIEDQTLAVPAANFNEQRRAASSIVSNKVALGSAGSKTALVRRDPQTADVWRELDEIMIHDPMLGINYLVARILAYTFDEGLPTQTLTLDQFSSDFVSPFHDASQGGANQSPPTHPGVKRLQQAVFQIAKLFGKR